MTVVSLTRDDVLETHRRVGRRLAEAAFKEFPAGEATEAQIFAIERIFHSSADAFMTELGADNDHKLLAKIVIGSTLRSRYVDLVRSAPAIHELKGGGR